jgi:calcium-dependent protein kinase
VSEKEIEMLFTQLDTHKNNRINYSEFLAGTLKIQKHLNNARLWTLFKNFDVDDSGFITAQNLKDAFKHYGMTLTQEEVNEVFTKQGKNKDSQISFDEFKAMMMEKS